jgi:AcrR family transcriptional regulator
MQTHNRIVKESQKQLVERSYKAFVLSELADSLGIKPRNVRYDFKIRTALILHVVEQEAAKDVLTIQSLRQNDGSADDAFRGIVRNLATC